MKLTEIEIELIKKGRHPNYVWRPKPMIWNLKKEVIT